MAMTESVRRLRDELVERFGAARVLEHASLAPLTTFKVGGPADLLVELHAADDVVQTLRLASTHGVPVTVLGGGSNVLVSDAGIPGLVVRIHGGEVTEVGRGLVRADAGVTINGLVRWTVGRGLAGLEAWAGTPGTVGGAIHGNAHFQGRLVSALVSRVALATRDGRVIDVDADDMAFGYDTSRVQRSGEVVLASVFRVTSGEPDALRRTARASLAFRKRTQPLHMSSAGCIFQNVHPDKQHRLPEGMPPSAGALVDRAGLKGARVGGATVSDIHGNFIVSNGSASAADIRALVEWCRNSIQRQFGIALREEIVYLGDWR
jgi:UDP-N-acetylmuramate dehydrogenase